MLVSIRTPADNERSWRYVEKVSAAVHQAGAADDAIHFEYGHYAGEIEC